MGMKYLTKMRMFAIIGIISIFILFGTGLGLLIVGLTNQKELIIPGAIILGYSIPGLYLGLFTSIWTMAGLTQKRVIKPFLKATKIISKISLNPFVMLAAYYMQKAAKALFEEKKNTDSPLLVISPKAIREEMYKKIAESTKQEL